MRKTSDAVEILDALIGDDPEMWAMVHEAELQMRAGMVAYQLREDAGLSQEQLGAKVGHSADWVEDLEMGDFNGNSLDALKEVARVLGVDVSADVSRIEAIEPHKAPVGH